MAATFGVNNLHGLEPQTGHVHSSAVDSSIEVATLRDEMGVTVIAKPKKMITKNVTISGKGVPDFDALATGEAVKGTAFISSVKSTESEDFPEFEIQAVIYDDIA